MTEPLEKLPFPLVILGIFPHGFNLFLAFVSHSLKDDKMTITSQALDAPMCSPHITKEHGSSGPYCAPCREKNKCRSYSVHPTPSGPQSIACAPTPVCLMATALGYVLLAFLFLQLRHKSSDGHQNVLPKT